MEGKTQSQTLTVLVLQELWEVEELRDELLDIVGVVHEGLPGGRDGMELAVGAVEPEREDERELTMVKDERFGQVDNQLSD